MLVGKYMTQKPICVTEEMTMPEVTKLMKEKGVHRFPVVRGNELIGIVTDRDLRSAAPSQVIAFDGEERKLLPELYDLLCKIIVKEIMVKNVITISPEDTIIKAIYLMYKNHISGIPVLDSRGEISGILTESDIFRVMAELSGMSEGGVLCGFRLEDRPGIIGEVSDIIRGCGGRIVSIFSSEDSNDPGSRQVYIRIRNLPQKEEEVLKNDLEKKFTVLFMTQDNITG